MMITSLISYMYAIMKKLISEISLIIFITQMAVQLVSDVYTVIYQYLDEPSKAMMAMSCKSLLRLGIPRDVRGTHFCKCAAFYGYLELMQWARRQKFPWNEETCSFAICRRHIDVLKWSHLNGCVWDEWSCRAAIEQGDFTTLQWLRQHNCPWNEAVSGDASWWGHFEILKWLRDSGCPWDHWVVENAKRKQRYDIVAWAEKHGCPNYYVTR